VSGTAPFFPPSSLVVNVKDFGAKGDGTTDDTNSIAAAVTAVTPASVTALSGTVFFPAGTYVTGQINLPERVTLEGVGLATQLTLRASATTLENLIMNVQNYSGVNDAQACGVHKMRLEGNKGSVSGSNWNCGIVFQNSTPSGSYEYTDSRHQVSNVLIQNFSGDGFVQTGRGVVQGTNIQVWTCNGFGFNLSIDSMYTNCDAGGNGLDGFLVQGNNMLSNCKAWYSGYSLMTNRFGSSTAVSVSAPANSWDGGNITGGLTYSLANGFGNGFLYYNIGGSSAAGNFNGGESVGCCAQDNARAGFYIRGGRQTLVGIEADSNGHNGTSDGTSTGTPVGSFAGVDLGTSSNCTVSGLTWDRAANLNHQAAGLNIASGAAGNRVELIFYGKLNDNSTNMPPLQASSVIGTNNVKLGVMGGGFSTPSYSSSWTPDPFLAESHTMTLTGNTTVNNPALTGTNTGTGIYLTVGMRLSLTFTQDATGGRTVTLGNAFKTNGFAFSVAASTTSTITFAYDGTNWQAISGANGDYAGITSSRAARVESGSFLVTAIGGTSTSTSWTLGQVYYAPLDVAVSQTFTGLATDITVVGSGGTSPLIHLGLFADDGTGARPTGSVLTNTEVTFDPTSGTGDRYVAWGAAQTFGTGRLWIAFMLTSGSAMGSTPTVVTLAPTQVIGLASLGNNSHRGWCMSGSSNASTLPTVSSLFRNGGLWPIMGMKAQ